MRYFIASELQAGVLSVTSEVWQDAGPCCAAIGRFGCWGIKPFISQPFDSPMRVHVPLVTFCQNNAAALILFKTAALF